MSLLGQPSLRMGRVVYSSGKEGSVQLDTKTDHSERRTPCFLYVLSIFSAIGEFLFGYNTGVVSGAMLLIKDQFHLTSIKEEVIVSVTIGFAFLFALMRGWLNDRFGRKATSVIASVVFTVGAVVHVLGAAYHFWMLVVGRAILGMGIGMASMTILVYIAETEVKEIEIAVEEDRREKEIAAGRCNATTGEEPDLIYAYQYCPTNYSWMGIVGLAVYLMFFAPGMGPMPWTINSEIYPLWARSTCNSLATATNWLSNLLVSMTFLTLTETITKYGTYWLFVGIVTLALVFIGKTLSETQGVKLEEVENLFSQPLCSCSKSLVKHDEQTREVD